MHLYGCWMVLQNQVSEEAELGRLEPKACANGDSADNLNIGFHDLEQENAYGEDDDSYRDNNDDSCYGYETGYYNSEDFDTDYWIAKFLFYFLGLVYVIFCLELPDAKKRYNTMVKHFSSPLWVSAFWYSQV